MLGSLLPYSSPQPQSYWIGQYPFSFPQPFAPNSFRNIFPGVYALFNMGAPNLRYIGQTGSFAARLDDNHPAIQKILSESPYNQVYASFYYVSDESTRKAIEQELIQQFQPIYNTQYNSLRNALLGLRTN